MKKLKKLRYNTQKEGGKMDIEKIYKVLINIIAKKNNVTVTTNIQRKEVSINENN